MYKSFKDVIVKKRAIEYFKQKSVAHTHDFYKEIYKDEQDFDNRIFFIDKILLELEFQGILKSIKCDRIKIHDKMWRYII